MRCKLEAVGGKKGRAKPSLIPFNPWAARDSNNTWFLVKLMAKSVVSLVFSPKLGKALVEIALYTMRMCNFDQHCCTDTRTWITVHAACADTNDILHFWPRLLHRHKDRTVVHVDCTSTAMQQLEIASVDTALYTCEILRLWPTTLHRHKHWITMHVAWWPAANLGTALLDTDLYTCENLDLAAFTSSKTTLRCKRKHTDWKFCRTALPALLVGCALA